MKGVETGERLTRHVDAAPQEGLYPSADEGEVPRAARRDAHRGESPLVPQEEVPRQAEEDGDGEEAEARYPEELPRLPVRLQKERGEDVDEHDEDGELRPPVVERAEEPAHVELRHDVDDALVGLFEVRDIVEAQGPCR